MVVELLTLEVIWVGGESGVEGEPGQDPGIVGRY